jgi:hypothetical protein
MLYVSIAVCFVFMLRISNVARPSKSCSGHAYLNNEVAFELGDGTFVLTMDLPAVLPPGSTISSVVFTQFSSKTGTKGQGRDQYLSRLIPEEALLIDDVVLFCLLKNTLDPLDVFFSQSRNGRTKHLTSKMVSTELKEAAVHFGLPPDHYSTHSLRIGSSTEVAHSGASMADLQRAGGWKTPSIAQQYPERIPSTLATTTGLPRVSHQSLLRMANLKGLQSSSSST